MDISQQPEFECLDVKLLDFIMAMCSQHTELKRKVERCNHSHKTEISKIKHRINMMERFLKIMTIPPAEQSLSEVQSPEGPKSSQAIISAYAEMQRKYNGSQVDENGNVLQSNSCDTDNNQMKWNVEAVERLLKEAKLAESEVEKGNPQNPKQSSEEDLQSIPIIHLDDCPPSQIPPQPLPKPRNTAAEFERGRFLGGENPTKGKDWTTKRGTTLKYQWTFWIYRKNKKYSYEDNLLKGSNFATWDHFIFSLNSVKSANELQRDSKYIVFKTGVRPVFEDSANIGGAKWVIIFQKRSHGELNNRWRELLLCVVGGTFSENGRFITGVEVSVRKKVDKISVWISRGLSQERAWSIRKMIQDRLFLDSTVTIKYLLHPKTSQTADTLSDFCF